MKCSTSLTKTIAVKMLPIFFGILLFSALFESGYGFGQSRIFQGETVDINDAPCMARVRIKINATVEGACGGTILSDMFILTAGHCVTVETNMNKPNPPLHDPSNFTILVGTNDLDDEESGQVIEVSKVHFKEFSQKNDIAILQLSEKIMLDGVTKDPVSLPESSSYKPENRTKCFVDGWGKNPQKSHKLLRGKVYTISEEECNTGADVGRDRSHQICTLGANGAGPCTGDSGGPLIRASDATQIGLVSFVPVNCASPGKTVSTFTAIAPNLEWIHSIMEMDVSDTSDAAASCDSMDDCDSMEDPDPMEDCDSMDDCDSMEDPDLMEDCDSMDDRDAMDDDDTIPL
ncbi:chymotrypsin-1-like [Bradysia coprophila]|uniref:chymotrypsin-1-like n=1 Tax=Bradysia coprophila TaxID=38358 RepID=UPI00187D7768|nr:chymotrypsin-1-like [Bradysia coprophila]